MEQAQQNTAQELTAQAIPQQAVEDACFHSLGLIGRNCEYLEQHLARVGADAQSLQAVSDISAATAKLERTINELLSALEFLRAGQPPKLYPLDLCELLQQVADGFLGNMVVTPREIDEMVLSVADLLSEGLNRALQPSLDEETLHTYFHA
jgi:hypothetical protein